MGRRKSHRCHLRSRAWTELEICWPAQQHKYWRSAAYLKRIRKRRDDKHWFCNEPKRMARSHVLLRCPNARLSAARVEAWEGRDAGSTQVFLANPRWEKRFSSFRSCQVWEG